MESRHPLEQRYGFFSETRASKLTRTMLSEALPTLTEGMSFCAMTRTGKTALTMAIEETFTKKKTAYFIRRRLINFRERRVANPFLRRLRGVENGPDAADVHNRPMLALKNHCLNQCDQLKTDTVIFCLDEAQNLSLEELDVLMILTGDLNDVGLKTFVLLFGQPELELLRDSLLEWKRGELVTRWMGSLVKLPGFDSTDFKSLCTTVDTLTWPKDSGPTYTQHYVPELWSQGWRLEHHAAPLWNELRSLAEAAKMRTEPFEIGGEYARNAVLGLLRQMRKLAAQGGGAVPYKEAARLSRITDIANVQMPSKADTKMLRASWMRHGLQRK